MKFKKYATILLASSMLLLAACSDEKEKEGMTDKELQEEIDKIGNGGEKKTELTEETLEVPEGVMLYEDKDNTLLSEDEYLKVSYKGIRTFVDKNGMKQYGFNEEQARIYEVLLYVENDTAEDLILKGGDILKLDDKEYNGLTYVLEETINAKSKREISVLLYSYGGKLVKVDIDNIKNINLEYHITSLFDSENIYKTYKKDIAVGVKNEENVKKTLESIKVASEEAAKLKQEQIELMIESGISEEYIDEFKKDDTVLGVKVVDDGKETTTETTEKKTDDKK